MAPVGLPGIASATTPGSQLWAKRYDGPASGYDFASALAVSPDGSTLFVTGSSEGATSGFDFATAAYDTATGEQLWARRYNGPRNRSDEARAIEVSPDGSRVFVTGEVAGKQRKADYATVAYDAATGARLWATRYNGRGPGSYDQPRALGVSPDGSQVFVTGRSHGRTTYLDYATVAYDAATGVVLWVKRYHGLGLNSWEVANALGVSPDGNEVFVTGYSFGAAAGTEFATVAYDAATGAELWVRRHSGPAGSNSYTGANSLGVSPDGTSVYVTGSIGGSADYSDFGTIAYDAAAGTTLWKARYGRKSSIDIATSLGVSPDGSEVFATGYSYSAATQAAGDYATVAYDASTGDQLWAARPYNGPFRSDDRAAALVVSPDGTEVFVTGFSTGTTGTGIHHDYATLAYDAATGARLWARRHTDTGGGDATAIGVSPDGTEVFVTGISNGSTDYPFDYDYLTIAYRVT